MPTCPKLYLQAGQGQFRPPTNPVTNFLTDFPTAPGPPIPLHHVFSLSRQNHRLLQINSVFCYFQLRRTQSFPLMADPLSLLVTFIFGLLITISLYLFFLLLAFFLFFKFTLMFPINSDRLSSLSVLFFLIFVSFLAAIVIFTSPTPALAFAHDTRTLDDAIQVLSLGENIPTYLPNTPLIVTARYSDQEIYLNEVALSRTAVVIYAVDQLFDSFFRASRHLYPRIISVDNLQCRKPYCIRGTPTLDDVLYVNMYGAMEDFLELQFGKYRDRTKLTIFAPQLEGDVRDFLPDFTQYRSFLCGHVVPCKLTLRDLQYYAKTNILLPTFFEGYTIHITQSARNKLLIALNLRRFRPDPLSDSEVCSVAQTSLRPGSTGLFGRPRDIPDCTVSHMEQRPNGSPTVMNSNICVDWRAVDVIMFQESVWKNVRYSCTAQLADYHLATDALKAIRDSFLSAFLDTQLIDTARQLKLTVLAPVNEHDKSYWLNYIAHYGQHLIPCRVTWSDLLSFKEGTLLPTLAKDPLFEVVITKSNGTVLLNDVPVVYPDLYSSDTMVIHGIASKIQFKEYDASPVP